MALFNKASAAVAEPEPVTTIPPALFDDLIANLTRVLENSEARTSERTRHAGGDWMYAGRAAAIAWFLRVAYEEGLTPDQDAIVRELERRTLHLINNVGSVLGAQGLIEVLSFPRATVSPELSAWALLQRRKRMPADDAAGSMEMAQRLRERMQTETLIAELEKEQEKITSLPGRIQTLKDHAAELRNPPASAPLPWEQ